MLSPKWRLEYRKVEVIFDSIASIKAGNEYAFTLLLSFVADGVYDVNDNYTEVSTIVNSISADINDNGWMYPFGRPNIIFKVSSG
jgi:hypothetical protein